MSPTPADRNPMAPIPCLGPTTALSTLFHTSYGKANPDRPGTVPVVGSSGPYGWTELPLVSEPTIVVGRKGNAGKAWLIEEPCHPSDTTFYLIPRVRGSIDLRFFFFAIRFCGPGASDDVIPSPQRQDLADLGVPCPKLEEQRAIALVLSRIQEAMALEDKRIATLKELKAAAMAKVFREGLRGEPLKQTEIGEVPESWEVATIGRHADIGNGSTPNRSNPAYWDDGSCPWITSTKVHDVFIETADEFVTHQAADECHLPLVRRGSLVVAITGQGKTLGSAAMVALDTFINQHLAYIRFKDAGLVPGFLLFFLQSRYADLRRSGQGGGTTKGALTCHFLRQYPIPVPALEEQQEIARFLTAISERVVIAERRRRSLEDLFSSTLHQLMTGQLRVTPLLEQEPAHAT